MARRVRRLLALLLPTAAAAIVFVRRSSQERSPASTPGPQWPAFDMAPSSAGPSSAGPVATTQSPSARWVAPVDGRCPDGYPVKANDNSGIFHVPGGRFYERTVPERCYAHADDAMADGYRAAKA